MHIFIGNLSFATKEDDVKAIFEVVFVNLSVKENL
jgi:hypothetical protein